eukprot:scaffold30163_cov124-Isochrysis_galbana.AAC.10
MRRCGCGMGAGRRPRWVGRRQDGLSHHVLHVRLGPAVNAYLLEFQGAVSPASSKDETCGKGLRAAKRLVAHVYVLNVDARVGLRQELLLEQSKERALAPAPPRNFSLFSYQCGQGGRNCRLRLMAHSLEGPGGFLQRSDNDGKLVDLNED